MTGVSENEPSVNERVAVAFSTTPVPAVASIPKLTDPRNLGIRAIIYLFLFDGLNDLSECRTGVTFKRIDLPRLEVILHAADAASLCNAQVFVVHAPPKRSALSGRQHWCGI
uniref:Uncharacterized protein n=1 Tax=uncultured marine virus TaxID=186617 RepID=A0A0F7L5R4_9VIRU|nr:hypothetical protein [uncultured marine virus]